MTPTRPEPVHLDPDPLTVWPEPIKKTIGPSDDSHGPGFPAGALLLGIALLIVIFAAIATAAPSEAPRPSDAPASKAAGLRGASPAGVAQRQSTAGRIPGRAEVAGSSPVLGGESLGDAPLAAREHAVPLHHLPDTATDVAGKASWYCGGGSACTRGYPPGTLAAAAGPALRVGDWRGRIVKVCNVGGDRKTQCVRVQLVDWCFCGSGRVIDLFRYPFSKLANPSRGVINVTVTWGGNTLPLPPTDTDHVK